jgi:hypothetical protein
MRMAAVRQERAVGNKARQVEQEGWLGFEGLGVSGFVSEEGAARRGEGAEGEEGRGDEAPYLSRRDCNENPPAVRSI